MVMSSVHLVAVDFHRSDEADDENSPRPCDPACDGIKKKRVNFSNPLVTRSCVASVSAKRKPIFDDDELLELYKLEVRNKSGPSGRRPITGQSPLSQADDNLAIQLQSALGDVSHVSKVVAQPGIDHFLVPSRFSTSSSNRVCKKSKVDANEVGRRCASPERLTVNSLLKLLKLGKVDSNKQTVKQFLNRFGISLSDNQQVLSAFTEFSEDDSATLAKALGDVATDMLPIDSIAASLLQSSKFALQETKKTKFEFHFFSEMFKCVMEAVSQHDENFRLLTHDFGPEVMKSIEVIFERIITKGLAILDRQV